MDAADVVRRFYDEVWTGGRLDRAGDFLAPDLVDHDALAFPGRAEGADGLVQVIGMVRAAVPDLERRIVQQVTDGELVATRFTDVGTNGGDFMGVGATGRAISLAGINLERVVDGRIVELWHVEDLYGLMQQIGAGV